MSSSSCPPRRSRSARSLLMLLSLVVVGAPSGSSAQGPTQHYLQSGARLNGLDMDDDFIVGEPEDSLVCDSVGGTVAATGFYVEDVDGDAVLEDQIFVDSDLGSDDATCGAPTAPCATIDFAFNTRADGPDLGGEDIVCAHGTFFETVLPVTSGVASFKTKPIDTVSTNEQREFRYPDNPAMIVGWDTDDDDAYPPLDPDDLFVFDNEGEGAPLFNFLTDPDDGADYIEIAHFLSHRPGTQYATAGGFLGTPNGATDERSEYWYMHDFQAVEVNFRKCHITGTMFVSTFQFRPRYFAIEYADLPRLYGYVFRGGFNQNDSSMCLDRGPTRFRGIDLSMRALGENQIDRHGNACTNLAPGATGGGSLRRQWGCYTGWEDIDNRYVVAGYDSPPAGANDLISGGVWLSCPQDIDFVGNYLSGFDGLPKVQPTNSVCRQRFLSDFKVNRNTFVDPISLDGRFVVGTGATGTAVGDPASNGFVGTFEMKENRIDTSSLAGTGAISSAVFIMESSNAGSDFSGMTWDVQDNVVISDIDRSGTGLLEQHGAPVGTIIHRGNRYINPTPDAGDANDVMVRIQDTTDYRGGDNGYYQCGRWRWVNENTNSLDTWQSQSGEEESSYCFAPCTTDSSDLCLGGSRYHVQVQWRTAQGETGAGQASPLSIDSGFFWFFGPSNLEVVVKVLDGCAVNGKSWVFAGGLTDVEVRVTVTDTLTNTSREYFNPLGTAFPAIRDTSAFDGCP